MATRSRQSKKVLSPMPRNDINKDLLEVDQLSEQSRALYMLLSTKFEEIVRNFEEKLVARDERIDHLQLQVSNLIKDNHQLTERLDEMECRAREDTLVVTGPNVPSASAQENVSESVIRRKYIQERSILIRLRTKGIRCDLLFSAKKNLTFWPVC